MSHPKNGDLLAVLTERLHLNAAEEAAKDVEIFGGKENALLNPLSSNLAPPPLIPSDESELDEAGALESEEEVQDAVSEDSKPAKKFDDPQSHNNGSFRGRPSSCVFVASLSSSMSDDHLCMSVTKHFLKWGELSMVKVLRDTSNRPYAFVQFSTDVDAKKAILEGQHSILDGRSIRCESARVNRTLYIAPESVQELGVDHVRESMEEFGEVEQLMPYPLYGGLHPRQARSGDKTSHAFFCKYAYRDDAIRAYANLRNDRAWIVEWAQNLDSPADMLEDVTIDKFSVFVGQLDPRVTEEKLVDRFSNHGPIAEAVLVQRPNNNCFGFIKFETEVAAAAAVEKENHAIFMEKTMHVQYREMHHNNHKRSSEMKLTLAPPPINLPSRRASTGTVSSRSSFGKGNGSFSRNRRASGEIINPRAESMYGSRSFKSNSGFPSYAQASTSSSNEVSSFRSSRFSRNDHNSSKASSVTFKDRGRIDYYAPEDDSTDRTLNDDLEHTLTDDCEKAHTPLKIKGRKEITPGTSPSLNTAGSPGLSKTLYSPSTVGYSDRPDEVLGFKRRGPNVDPGQVQHPPQVSIPHFYYVPTKEVYGSYEYAPIAHGAMPPYYYGAYQPYPQYEGMEYAQGTMPQYYMYYPHHVPFNAGQPSEFAPPHAPTKSTTSDNVGAVAGTNTNVKEGAVEDELN
ncbi:hypothetical protein BABINDRAFT_13877 [Babjeviella inositovora NRRL Y-12698]|uniref:RRM domain-containing protein n=1 Tax=Babjeviella inositovora NRRL Y-12698 TaxID=984486 RepID=A0A1E3QR76_9ASCO|nr:uncharacterized protein BABINDRAFT_13877 [Babjeviella inositovora NRRL Y-12698]ODQ79562.1 hypothetical protein BABINDRAFT_13877 [Babjeviella inositovora NRRL Y-12698]